MQQLLRFAMQRILDSAEDSLTAAGDPNDSSLQVPGSTLQPSASRESEAISPLQLRQRVDDYMRSQTYRRLFRLPHVEQLDMDDSCIIFNMFERTTIPGRFYLSIRFLCFESKSDGELRLVLPLKEVVVVEVTTENDFLSNAIHIKTRNSNSFFFAALPQRDTLFKKLTQYAQGARHLAGVLTPSPSNPDLVGLAQGAESTASAGAIELGLEVEPLYKAFGEVSSSSRYALRVKQTVRCSYPTFHNIS